MLSAMRGCSRRSRTVISSGSLALTIGEMYSHRRTGHMTVIDELRLAHGHITREVIGAFYDVYNGLGYGYVESVYANAMALALEVRGLHFEREKALTVHYLGQMVGEFRCDLLVEQQVIVEHKTAERIAASHESQTLNYLRASGLSVGLILNFGAKPSKRRILWTRGEEHVRRNH